MSLASFEGRVRNQCRNWAILGLWPALFSIPHHSLNNNSESRGRPPTHAYGDALIHKSLIDHALRQLVKMEREGMSKHKNKMVNDEQ